MEYPSCVRADTTRLDFNGEFAMFMVIANFSGLWECAALCAGWEL